MKPAIPLTDAEKKEMTSLIQTYFLEERGEELGELAAFLVLDFFMKDLAPLIYNIGVRDAHTFLQEKLEDIFELEK
ncbi:DUF2164 domain-containing protein [Radiobacillus kanasensis]|uniref:DUF2164 family protein n=1 Tax=Radiobacillus kanasensis TaxID=2844358 RepID=UPI001E43670C|nr:DUF2164 family protein [Radiobacillus kanasensis]UFT99996.1 DUF2164 domain-containing protein [Radiobacillus kanasensis]